MGDSSATIAPAAFARRLAGSVLVINLFVWGLAGWSLEQSRRQYQEQASVTAYNLVQVLVEAMNRKLDTIDMALLSGVDEVEEQLAGERIDRDLLNRRLGHLHRHLPEVISLRITDADGNVRYGNEVSAATRINLADRPFFTGQRDAPSDDMMITAPVFARISKTWVVPISRRINAPDGTFAGVVYANIALEHLVKSFSLMQTGPGGVVTLRDLELGLVARYPEPEGIGSRVGDREVNPRFREGVRAGRNEGIFMFASGPGTSERTFAYQRVSSHPYFISVDLDAADYLAGWRYQMAIVVVGAILFGIITLASARLLYRAWQRQMADHRRIRQEVRERLRSEAELQRINEELDHLVMARSMELRAANKELQEASYAAAHNLRSPLRAVNGFAILLQEEGERLTAEGQEMLREMLSSAREMEQIVEGFLRLIRATNDGLTLQPVQLSVLAEAILARHRADEPQRQVAWEVEPGLVVEGDAMLLQSVLEYLLDNAWKFTATIPGTGRITFTASQEGGETVYSVRDNGTGFSMAHAGRLFQPFQRVHRQTEFYGVSVNLAIVRRIIARHGGRIWAESVPGQGAVFMFTLLGKEKGNGKRRNDLAGG